MGAKEGEGVDGERREKIQQYRSRGHISIHFFIFIFFLVWLLTIAKQNLIPFPTIFSLPLLLSRRMLVSLKLATIPSSKRVIASFPQP